MNARNTIARWTALLALLGFSAWALQEPDLPQQEAPQVRSGPAQAASADLADRWLRELQRGADARHLERPEDLGQRWLPARASIGQPSGSTTSDPVRGLLEARRFELLQQRIEQEDLPPMVEERLRRSRDKVLAALARPGQDRPSETATTAIFGNDALPLYRGSWAAPPLATGAGVQPSYLQVPAPSPGPNDLLDSPDAPLHPEIVAKASELGYEYTRILDFVRAGIRTEWYPGGQRGALGCLRARAGNDVDQASLLIALLRASNVPARYVRGAGRVSLAELEASLNLQGSAGVLRALNRALRPHRPFLQGGVVAAVDLDLTWVSAYVPFVHYRGSAASQSGHMWLPLAPAIKPHVSRAAGRLLTLAGISPDAVIQEFLASDPAMPPVERLRVLVQPHLTANPSLGTYADQLAAVRTAGPDFELLPTSLPFEVLSVRAERTALAPEDSARLQVVVLDAGQALLTADLSVIEASSQRLTVSFQPASADDQNLLNRLGGGLNDIPPYLVNLRPRVSVDGRVLVVGDAVQAARSLRLRIRLQVGGETREVEQAMVAGGIAGILIDTGAPRPAEELDGEVLGDSEAPVSKVLGNLAARYAEDCRQSSGEIADLLGVRTIEPLPAVVLALTQMDVESIDGVPMRLRFDSVAIDAAVRGVDAISRGGHGADENGWFALAALQCSYLEHSVFQDQWSVPAVSADRGLARAHAAGMPIHLLSGSAGLAQLPSLAHPEPVKATLATWLQRGHEVRIPTTQIDIGAWRGSVWQVVAADGSAGYFVSGGLAGGVTTLPPSQWFLANLGALFSDIYGVPPNHDATDVLAIRLFDDSDQQIGTVGTELPVPLRARIEDPNGRPVVGANVRFRITSGGGSLSSGGTTGTSLNLISDERGLVEARLRLGTRIQGGRYVYEDPDNPDLYPQFMGSNRVEVSAASRHSPQGIAAGRDYEAFGRPGSTRQIYVAGPVEIAYPNGERVIWMLPGIGYATWYIAARDEHENAIANAQVRVATTFVPNFTHPSGSPTIPCEPADYENHLSGGVFLPGQCPNQPVLSGNQCLQASRDFMLRAGDNYVNIAPHNVVGAELRVTFSAQGAPEVVKKIFNEGAIYEDPAPDSPGLCRGYFGPGDLILVHPVQTSSSLAQAIGQGAAEFPPAQYYPGYYNTRTDTIESARPGDWLPVPRSFSLWVDPSAGVRHDNLLATWQSGLPRFFGTPPTPQFSLTASEGAGIGPLFWLGAGDYQYNVRMPPAPGRVEVQGRLSPAGSAGYFEFDFPPVWSVRPAIGGVQPLPLVVSAAGTVAHDLTVERQLLPPEFRSGNSLNEFERSGEIVASYPGGALQGQSTLRIDRGWTFEHDRNYSIKFSINEGTPYRIESERFPLTSVDDVLIGVGLHSGKPQELSNGDATALALRGTEHSLLLRTINVSAGTSCNNSGEVVFLLARRARVRIDYFRTPFSSSPDGNLVDEAWFDAGIHRELVSANDLPIGRLRLRVRAEAENGAIEEQDTNVTHSFERRDHLALGHTVISDVDLFDGQITVSRQDASLAGRGPPVGFQRTWSSQQGWRIGTLGRGWSSDLNVELHLSACLPQLVGAQGAGTEFEPVGPEPDGSLRFRALHGYHGSLYLRPDGSYDAIAKDGTRYHFSTTHRFLHPVGNHRVLPVSFSEDPNGNRVDRTYQWLGGLPVTTRLNGSGGRTLQFEYELRGIGGHEGEPGVYPLMVRARGPGEFDLRFEYDDQAQLVRAFRIDAPRDERYTYQDYGMAMGTDQSFHHLGSRMRTVRDEIAARVKQSFDYELQWVHSPRGNGEIYVLPELRVTRHANALGQATLFNYQGLRGLGLPVNTLVTSPRSLITDYRMNGFGGVDQVTDAIGLSRTEWNLVHRQPDRQIDRENVTTEFTYDEYGNVLRERRFGRGTPVEQLYTWKAPDQFDLRILNRPASHTDFAGVGEIYQYNRQGNRVARTRAGESESWTIASNGDISSWTDFEGAPTSYSYSSQGLPERTVHPDGAVTRQTYDARGRMRSRIDEIGRVETYEYDGLDRLTRTTFADNTARSVEFDDAVDLRREYDELGRLTAYQQDALGRTVKVTNALGDFRETGYDGHGNVVRERKFDGTVTTHEYDALDRRERTIEPLGRITERDFDKMGNVLEERIALGPKVRTARHQYNHPRYFRTRSARLLGGSEVETLEEHDGEGRLTKTTDPLGRFVEIDYDGFGRETERREFLGRITQRNYDGMGRLSSELILFPGQSTLTRSWTYDLRGRERTATDRAGGRTERSYDAAGQLLSTTDPTGRATIYAYDQRGRVLSETRPGDGRVRSVTYDQAGNIVSETRPSQSPIAHTYDALNRRRVSSDALGLIEELEYDEEGRVKLRKDAAQAITTYEYDALGRMILEIRPMARSWIRTWTPHDELASETNPRSFTTSHSYDELGRRTSTTDEAGSQTFGFDLVGNQTSHTDRLQRLTRFDYDALNRRVRQDDPAPLTSHQLWGYDALDRVVSQTDRNGVETLLTLDGEGRERQRSRAGRNELQTYDNAGRRISSTDAQGRVTTFSYDAAGRLEEERRPLGAVLRYRYGNADQLLSSTDADGIVTTFGYDLRLQKTSETDALGKSTLFEWDLRGLRTAIIKPESVDHRWEFDYDQAGRLERVTDPLGHETVYGYDRADNLTSVTNARGELTRHEYDALNRLTATFHPGGGQESFTPDAEGNRVVWVRENGQRIEMDYDPINRLLETRRLPAAVDGIQRVTRLYDGNGNLTRVEEHPDSGPLRVWSASYDAFNRRIEWTDRNGVTVRQRFDASDNRIERTGPEGSTVYTYNALDQLSGVTLPAAATPMIATVSPAGRLSALDHGNGTRTEVNRDAVGRVRQMRHLLGAAAMLTLGYTLDANGHRVAESWERGAERVEIAYELDLAERLKAVTTDGQRIEYTLDENGNRTAETLPGGVVRTHHFDARDRLFETRENDQVTASYGYDAAGRQITHTAGGITRTYEYDTQDRLLAVTQNGTPLVRYESDAFGQRTLRDAQGQIEQYQWDGTRLAGRTNATGTSLGDYQYAYGWAVSSREGTARSTLHTDVHGTPQLITDATAAIAGWTRTDVWGVEKAQNGAQSRLGHTGYLKDPLLGDELYAQARQYRAGTGRFTSRDEWSGDNLNPITLNKYLYANGNPGSYLDPDGRRGCDTTACGLAQLRNQMKTPEDIARVDARIKAHTQSMSKGLSRSAGAAVGIGELAVQGAIETASTIADTLIAPFEVATRGAINLGSAARNEARLADVSSGIVDAITEPDAVFVEPIRDVARLIKQGRDFEAGKRLAPYYAAASSPVAGLRSAPRAASPMQLTEAPSGGVSVWLENDLSQFDRDAPMGGGGVSVAHNDAIKLNTKASIGDQGMPYEDLAASIPDIGDRLPPNFKTFDYFNESSGVATSIKTLDTTTASRINNPSRVYDTLRRDINKAANFEKYELQGRVLNSSFISERVLRVAVPKATNAEQWAQVQRAIEHGRSVGVEVVVETVDVQ